MKKFTIKLVKFYQKSISPLNKLIWPLGACRFSPTCSEYTILAIEKYGVVKGCWLGAVRIARCNPLSDGGFEEVS